MSVCLQAVGVPLYPSIVQAAQQGYMQLSHTLRAAFYCAHCTITNVWCLRYHKTFKVI